MSGVLFFIAKKTAAHKTISTMTHSKTIGVFCGVCTSTPADTLSNLEFSGVDAGVELLEGTVRELPGVFKSPKRVVWFDGVIGRVGTRSGSGFGCEDNFTTDWESLCVILGVELL